MEKYYTPSMEEFHLGFEFEVNKLMNLIPDQIDEWQHTSIRIGDFWIGTSSSIDLEKAIRVKYLDKEDIENLGWMNPKEYKDRIIFHGKYNLLYWTPEIRQVIITDVIGNLKEGEEAPVKYLFAGTIQNKSELRRVMKMIGI